jgi:hypothetical protein
MKAALIAFLLVMVALIATFVLAQVGAQATTGILTPESVIQPAVAAIIPKASASAESDVPGKNYALAANGATITGGTHPEALIDGISTDYDGGRGFGYTHWKSAPPQSFLIDLKEASEIDCIRFLLWDIEENRFYRYTLDIQAEGKLFEVVSDKSAVTEECRSWQVVRFPKQKVKTIRLTGTYNSANSGFHVVELQALMAPRNGFTPDPKSIPQKQPPPEHLEF